MFDIDEKVVKDSCDYITYQEGLQCYNNNAVEEIDIKIQERGVKRTEITAKVKASSDSSRKYDTKVLFMDITSRINCSCDCNAYSGYYNYNSPCKHIVAVLIKYSREKNKLLKAQKMKKNKELIQNLKQIFLQTNSKVEKKSLKLEYKLNLTAGYNSHTYLELKIGEDKLYVVKNMREFIESIADINGLQFGKNFTYDPNIHQFKDEDKRIINILKDIYETERVAESLTKYGDRSVKFFSGKKAYLTEGNLDKFFQALGDRSIDLTVNDVSFCNVTVEKENFPLEFKLTTSKDGIILQQTTEVAIPFTPEGEYFYYNNKIYKPNPEDIKVYAPIFNAISKETNKRSISFSENESEEIASYIIPALKKISKTVEVHKSLQNKFREEPLKSLVYLDKYDEGVTAEVKFKYGDREINKINDTDKIQSKEIIIKDIEGEVAVIGALLSYHFEESKDGFLLKDEEMVLDFVAKGIDKLQEMAEVYYSESFKNIKVYSSKSFKSNIRLNAEDLLEFSFNIDGVDRQELKDIFHALKQKKKYYRLKSGGFIPLQNNELQHIGDMIDYLNIKTADFEKDKIILPKYNAAYIDTSLKDNNITFVERNKKFRELVNNIKDIGDMDYTIPENLNTIMRGYQKFGFKWFKTLANCGFGGILADEMGLGKTLQTISFIASEIEQENKSPCLVVCPTSLVYNWEDEVNKFQPSLNCLVVSGSKDAREEQRKKIEEADIVITSYALIKRDIEEYKDIKFKYCFLDEAQNIKNPDSLNAQSVKSIKAKGYFALTGTPIENSITELWSIFDFIMPGYLLNHRKFVQKYEMPIVKNADKKALEELNKHIKPFILRRLKNDVIKELPPKIEHNVIVDMTDEQKKVYAAYLQQAKEEVDEEIRDKGLNKSKIKILSILTRLRQICCDPSTFIDNYKGDNGKMEALMDIVGNNVSEGHKILLFSQFTSVLKNIGEKFKKEDIKYMYLDGSTKAEQRGEMVKEFNQGEIPIFLISLKAGGTGLNLTSADMVIHFDPWWNPAVEEQASDRAHRIGQKKTVEVIRLISKGTIEEKIYKIQQRKKEIINNVINENTGEEVLLSNMGEKDIEELFNQGV